MRLMLSSMESDSTHIQHLAHYSKYSLTSYYYYAKRRGKNEYIDRHYKELNNKDRFMIDSGAFTFMERGTNINNLDDYIESYIQFVKELKIKRYIEMDIDSLIGFDEVLKIRERLEQKIGWKSIPVWHKNRGIEEWERMVHDYDYIAFGGFNDTSGWGVKSNEYDDVKKMVAYANSKNVKVHGLGFTKVDSHEYGFYSVDSSSWSMGRRFGVLYKFENGVMRQINKPENTRVNRTIAERNNFIEWVKFQRYVENK